MMVISGCISIESVTGKIGSGNQVQTFPVKVKTFSVVFKGFDVYFGDLGDTNNCDEKKINRVAASVDGSRIDDRSIKVEAKLAIKDNSGNFDDRYSGQVWYDIIAE